MFLALGLGILMGSVVLSDRYVARLEARVQTIHEQLDQRRQDIVVLTERLDESEEFSSQAQERLIDRRLLGQEVVLFELPRTDGALRDAVSESIEAADGAIISRIVLTERFALEDDEAVGELAAILGTSTTDPVELRQEAVEMLGQRAAGAAARAEPVRGDFAAQRLMTLVEALRDADFLDVGGDDDPAVVPDAAFVLVGGGSEEPPVGTRRIAIGLASALAIRGAPVVVTESGSSGWGLVQRLRSEPDAGAAVTTVDGGDSVPGRVGVVLGLELTIDGVTGHYGTGEGATAIVPPPTPVD